MTQIRSTELQGVPGRTGSDESAEASQGPCRLQGNLTTRRIWSELDPQFNRAPLSTDPFTVEGCNALEGDPGDVLDRAIAEHDPVRVFALFSGGHDSLCATHIASRHPRFSGCVHVNTGTGVLETRDFVAETCRRYGWPLIEKHPPGPTYRDLVLRYGFPGPAQHAVMYRYLKERALDALIREHKTKRSDRIVLVTGVRREESTRRMGTAQRVRRDGAAVWVAPIYDWSAFDRLPYIEAHGLPRNPVVDALHMSGECLCGCFAKPGELDTIAAWFPDAAASIRSLAADAASRGLPAKWGERPTLVHPDLPMFPGAALPGDGRWGRFQPLCSSCDWRASP